MKIKHIDLPSREFDEQVWQWVNDCRQTVGYHEALDWECPCLGEREYVEKHYPGKTNVIAGLLCFPCLIKEKERWQSLGVPLPTYQARFHTENGSPLE